MRKTNLWNRILSSMLCICMMLTLLPVGVLAADEETVEGSNLSEFSSQTELIPTSYELEDGYCAVCGAEQALSGVCGDNLTWSYCGNEETLTISGTGPMTDYSDGNTVTPWEDLYITKLVVEEGVTTIGNNAFKYTYLETVELPESLEAIGVRAFQSSYRLTQLIIPQNVKMIGEAAISYCSQLTSINIPDSVQTIGEGAFCYCDRLTTVTVGTGACKGLGDAFSGCERLEQFIVAEENPNFCMGSNGELFDKDKTVLFLAPRSISGCYVVPETVTNIAESAFEYCETLTGVIIPDSVQTIGQHSFLLCHGLQGILFAGSAPEIGIQAFFDVAATVYYPADDASWTEEVRQDYDGTLTWVPYSDTVLLTQPVDASVVVGQTGTASVAAYGTGLSYEWWTAPIGSDSFTKADATGNTYSTTLNSSADDRQVYCIITDAAGNQIRSNTAILRTYPKLELNKPVNDEITVSGESVHYSFTADTTCYYQFVYGEDVFGGVYGDSELLYHSNTIWFEEGETKLLTFGSYNILSFTIEVTHSADDYWTEVTKEATCTEDGEMTYHCNICDWMWSETIPADHKLEDAVCIYCGRQCCGKDVTWTFDEATGTLTISGTGPMADNSDDWTESAPWEDIGNQIKSVVVENGVTTIGENAFSGCENLTKVTLPDSLISIGYGAFSSCYSLKTLFIPASVEQLNRNAFWDIELLITVDANNPYFCTDKYGVLYSKTMDELIAACSSILPSVYIIPDTVKTIRSSAFSTQYRLNCVVIPGSVATIEGNAFFDCENLERVILEGSAPAFVGAHTFTYSSPVFYYPGEDATWTEEVRSNQNISMHIYELEWQPHYGAVIIRQPETVLSIPGKTVSVSAEAWGDGLTYEWWVKDPAGDTFLRSQVSGTTYAITLDNTTAGQQIYLVATTPDGTSVQSDTVTLDYYPEVALDQMATAQSLQDGEYGYVMFRPTFSCVYTFRTYEYPEIFGYTGIICDADGNVLTDEDDDDGDPFSISYQLEAGKIYLIGAKKEYYMSSTTVGITAKAHDPWSEITLAPTCTTTGEATFHCDICGEVWVETVPVVHSYENGHCTLCDTEEIYSGPCGETMTWTYNVPRRTLTISGTGVMQYYGYVSVDCPWEAWVDEMLYIIIEDGVTEIGFTSYGYDNLVSVTLPASVTVIGSNAFGEAGTLSHILYAGTEEQWAAVEISEYDTEVQNATVHFNATGNEITAKENCTLISFHCEECERNITTRHLGGRHSFGENGICTICGFDASKGIVINLIDYYGSGWDECALKIYEDGLLMATITVLGSDGGSVSWTMDYDSAKEYEIYWVQGYDRFGHGFEILVAGEAVLTATEEDCRHYSDGYRVYPVCQHSLEVVETPPTCYDYGYTTYTCGNCGLSYVDDYVDETGHSYGEGIVTAPTCTEDGYTTYICAACGNQWDKEYVAPLGHVLGADGNCTVCGELYTVPVWIGDVQITSQNMTGIMDEVLGDAIRYDPLINTLTLDDLNYETTIYSEIPLNIVVLGTNILAYESYDCISFNTYGGTITISGTGSLHCGRISVAARDATPANLIIGGSVTLDIDVDYWGIYMYGDNLNLQIKDEVKLIDVSGIEIEGGVHSTLDIADDAQVSIDEDFGVFYGIYAGGETSAITIGGNAVVDAYGGAYGIYAGSVTINGGTVTAYGDDWCGIVADEVTINAGTVTATGSESSGISAKYITVNGGSVTASSWGWSAISATELTINGGTIDITRGGLYIRSEERDGLLTLNGVKITAPEGATIGIWTDEYGYTYDAVLNADGTLADTLTISPIVRASITQKGRTLNYEDLIYVIDIFDLSGVEGIDLTKDAGLLFWSVEEFEALSEIAFDADHAKVGLKPYKTTGYYSGSSDGIFTRDLHKDAYYVGYVKLADGSYVYSEPKLYSPAIYAHTMLGKDTTSAETKELCVALLNYISAAQVYFHDTVEEELVNYELTDEQKALNWENISFNLAPEIPADKQVAMDESVFQRTGKNLLFEEMISIVSIFMVNDDIVSNAQESGTIYWTSEQFAALEGAPSINNIGDGTKVEFSRYRGNVNQWCSHAPEVAAKDMADTQYFYLGYVVHADGTVSYSGVISYTVEQYIYNTVNKTSTSPDMLAFAQWLYRYERAAKDAI